MPIINNNSEPDAVLSAFHTLTLFNPHITVSIVHSMLLQLQCVHDGIKRQVLSRQAWCRACHSAFLTSSQGSQCCQSPEPHFERPGCTKGCCCAHSPGSPAAVTVGCHQHTSAPLWGTALSQPKLPHQKRPGDGFLL